MRKLFLVLVLGFSGTAAASQLEVDLASSCSNPEGLTSLVEVTLRDRLHVYAGKGKDLYLLDSGHVLLCAPDVYEIFYKDVVSSIVIKRKK